MNRVRGPRCKEKVFPDCLLTSVRHRRSGTDVLDPRRFSSTLFNILGAMNPLSPTYLEAVQHFECRVNARSLSLEQAPTTRRFVDIDIPRSMDRKKDLGIKIFRRRCRILSLRFFLGFIASNPKKV